MWTNLTLSLHPVWDDCLWSVSATYLRSEVDEPVTLQRSGRTPLEGAQSPREIIAAVLPNLLVQLGQATAD